LGRSLEGVPEFFGQFSEFSASPEHGSKPVGKAGCAKYSLVATDLDEMIKRIVEAIYSMLRYVT
jgi:hypothetical protein